ncbi:Threonylcarbamoyl-AMP synthase [Lachnellula willkommii]|uniref:Threonylcarbamoyl-AMP synthase n=1 Tax=Lachnellula willkommii TaxID=215461 RepID=A0A559MAP0_9HELO|nr:Threonylcarbamoyl-AMP synthase [Lachnellula willkommii]
MASGQSNGVPLSTRILNVDATKFGSFQNPQTLETLELPRDLSPNDPLLQAAHHLKTSNIPVGFPTETVYGLGADATRSDAVKGIYKAKGRPSDNPLIIHICDLTMLRNYLVSANTKLSASDPDPIPEIYKPLIKEFWPGPLTILLPNPTPSKLAPEVTAGLSTFGARMPSSPLALSLIALAGVPLAAPSANASTKPSPTTAAHVLHDLTGRIELILNGGPCQVGVESTVVDGLCSPPVVLRPGGVSIERIRQCAGWEDTAKGYKDQSEIGANAPRAPGMKYKHYSPKAKVVLYEAASKRDTRTGRITNSGVPLEAWRLLAAKDNKLSYLGLESASWPVKVGIVSTKHWADWAGFHGAKWSTAEAPNRAAASDSDEAEHSDGEWDSVIVNHGTEEDPQYEPESFSPSWIRSTRSAHLKVFSRRPSASTSTSATTTFYSPQDTDPAVKTGELWQGGRPSGFASRSDDFEDDFLSDSRSRHVADMYEIALGGETADIAHGLFSALRELDARGVDVIYVEGIDDEGDGNGDGDVAAAVMNRLRKAASVIEK